MYTKIQLMMLLLAALLLTACASSLTRQPANGVTHVYLAADSTAADHTLNDDYWTKRHPITGWGQKFQPFVSGANLVPLRHLIKTEKAKVINKAKGGRSTRTFFEEGRWDDIYRALQPHDLVLIQFGHNDAAVEKHERYVNITGYKQYLRLFVQQTRDKHALPILLTPVNRNYPWDNDQLHNAHGDYPAAMKEVAQEMNVLLIDLGQLSRDFFSAKGQEFVSKTYFMNLPAGAFPAYPDGLNDNTHFQPKGAEEVARLVYQAMKNL
jgi:lysophospholipase L1-like esterase